MNYRLAAALVGAALLAGCQWLPEAPQSIAPPPTTGASCDREIPLLVESDCLLDAWVAFGLASQRGDREWRDGLLARLDGEDERSRLARAAVLAWGSEREWDRAATLLENTVIDDAPESLQPLLRYWRNDLEGRRALVGRLARSEDERRALVAERQELEEKLEALTAIEQSINLRQPSP
ncbi:hypothetical protein [Halomonas salifodinae]|uniref:hypothetical protein n=1 Tax=Halomonas salifodinae TaxID=438745 RepID=UPI00339F3269